MTTLDRLLAKLASQISELSTRLSRVVSRGRVVSVDHDGQTARVAIVEEDGRIEIEADLPWNTWPRDWDPPAVGDQVVVLCPSGEITGGWIVGAAYDDGHPAPSAEPAERSWRHADGAMIAYDAEAHNLDVALPAGATAALVAPGGVTVTGAVTVEGDLAVEGALTQDGRDVGAGHQHAYPDPATPPPGNQALTGAVLP